MRTFKDVNDLIYHCKYSGYDIVVLEGYEGVGKSRLTMKLSAGLKLPVYRPDYIYWNQYLEPKERFLIMRGFLEVASLARPTPRLIFDRGMVSGAVYAQDVKIAHDMKSLVVGLKILHVLVTVESEEDYRQLQLVRGKSHDEEYQKYLEFTHRYKEYLVASQLEWCQFSVRFDPGTANELKRSCGGCNYWRVSRQDYYSEDLVGICDCPNSYNFRKDRVSTEERCGLSGECDIDV